MWRRHFLKRSPMLAPLAARAMNLSACAEWPKRETLQQMVAAQGTCTARGTPLRLVVPQASSGEPHEVRVYRRAELQVRERDWHDLFNVLAWLTYPRAKAALNERHVSAALIEKARCTYDTSTTQRPNRGQVRDALTLLDENGAIVISTDPGLIEDLREFRWKRLFWRRREEVLAEMRFHIFGHALFHKALDPYVGMTAHAMSILVGADVLRTSPETQLKRIDEILAERIADPEFSTPRMLAPLPLLGVPGWWPANVTESFYDNERYFRPHRKSGCS